MFTLELEEKDSWQANLVRWTSRMAGDCSWWISSIIVRWAPGFKQLTCKVFTDSETEERDQTWCDFFVWGFRMLFSGIIERFYNKQIVKLMFAIINIYSQIRIPILRPSYSRSLTSLICKKNFLFIVRLWKKKTFENNIISLKTIFMNELYFRYFFRAITNCSGPHSGLCLVGC